ncbi:protein of unknown function [Vibrio tapetis subsp. tapetis]|uniref:Uncharacterized protein n=1 Tax=Vibrio tapetis subsp. tapetis TaxID=1671868 RepID=A0A2N8ZKV6_9VIBR|nr:protein of unknown function [Vibrio tapetis subsp. tapetis]
MPVEFDFGESEPLLTASKQNSTKIPASKRTTVKLAASI